MRSFMRAAKDWWRGNPGIAIELRVGWIYFNNVPVLPLLDIRCEFITAAPGAKSSIGPIRRFDTRED